MRRSLLVLVTAAAIGAAPAGAGVLSEDPLEGTSTELGVIVRAFSFVLAGDVLEPPILPADANPAGIGVFDLRGYFSRRTPSFKLVAHGQLTNTFNTQAESGALALGRGAAPARWLPMQAKLADEDTIGITAMMDWLYVAWSRGPVTVTAGRQPITFGRSKLWSPTDIVSTFALTEVDTEYKPGSDALRLDWHAGDRLNVAFIAATGELEDDSDIEASVQGTSLLARGTWGWERGELGALAGMIRGDVVAGGDAVLDMGSFEMYGEATATLLTEESVATPLAESGDVVAKAALGATFRPLDKVTLSPELLYNGFGGADGNDYLELVQSTRVAIGEQTTLGQAYLGVLASWEAHPLLNVGAVSLVNLRDPSALLSAVLSYSVGPNTEAVLGGYVPLGQSPTVDAALVLEDEFGVYPYFFFAEIKSVI